VEDLEVVIADPGTCQACPAGDIGEVWVAGGSVAKGYFNNPAETAATFGARLTSGRGPFLRTGDLGFQLDGELFITGRLKDLIVIRGLNYYPNDIEMSAEQAHPGVGAGACAAFAVDAGDQENLVVVAEVARQALHQINSENAAADRSGLCAAMAARIREQVAQDHELQIHELVLVRPGGIPRTSSGKIRRRDCRAMYLAGKLESLAIV
jgi:acyl-CoA synthetase (AMP-forming)/AMP-acid ligase II